MAYANISDYSSGVLLKIIIIQKIQSQDRNDYNAIQRLIVYALTYASLHINR